ncbi:hypothetical protein ES702_02586 [subsurface metagenome]
MINKEKEIIAGFALIIKTWCKACRKSPYECIVCEHCLYFKAASAGHLNIIKEWIAKEGVEHGRGR